MTETTRVIEAERSESAQRRLKYWEVFLSQLDLHDKDVPVPKPNSLGNLRFSLRGRDLWITVYSASSLGRIGVFMKGRTDDYQKLQAEKAAIELELGQELAWIESADSDTWGLSARHTCNPLDTADWPSQHQWLAAKLNKFLQFVKPRLASLQGE